MDATQVSFPLAATTLSLLAEAGAMLLLYRLVRPTAGELNSLLAVAALCAYPAAPILQAAYSESLGLLLLILSLLLLRSRRYGWLVIVVTALSLTRPIVLPLALAVAWHGWTRWRDRADDPFPAPQRWNLAAVGGATVLSFALWPLIAALTTGEPDAYMETQAAWGYSNSPDGVPWPSWFFMALRFTNILPIVLGLTLVLFLFILNPRARVWGGEVRAWGMAYGAYLLTSTQTRSSIIRLAMLLLIWLPFPFLPHKPRRPAFGTLLVGLVLVVGFISQHYWITWMYTPTGYRLPLPPYIGCCNP